MARVVARIDAKIIETKIIQILTKVLKISHTKNKITIKMIPIVSSQINNTTITKTIIPSVEEVTRVREVVGVVDIVTTLSVIFLIRTVNTQHKILCKITMKIINKMTIKSSPNSKMKISKLLKIVGAVVIAAVVVAVERITLTIKEEVTTIKRI